MSKRFGRNQKRKMREALHLAELAAGREYAGRMMAEGIARDNSRKLADLRENMAEVVGRLGNYAIAEGVPTTFQAGWLARNESFNLPVHQPFPSLFEYLSTAGEHATVAVHAELMRVLDISVVRDQMARDLHCRIEFDGIRLGYGISAHAIENMGRDELVRRMTPEIALMLANKLKDKAR